jgi:hypothetical protein
MMETKNILPAILIAVPGLILAGFGAWTLISNLNNGSSSGLGSQIVFIITGLFLFVFAIHYAKTGGQSDKELELEDEFAGIEWEFDEEFDEEPENQEEEK